MIRWRGVALAFEYDPDRMVVRCLGQHAERVPSAIAGYIASDGQPLCFRQAEKDPDGWVAIDEMLDLRVGHPARFLFYLGHPNRRFVGTVVGAVEVVE